MDNSLRALCDAIKKILAQLKPQINELSYIVMTSTNKQGKSALLKQSLMQEIPVLSEQLAKIYFNQTGIIVELGESWLNQSTTLLHNTLKQLNKCNRHLKISGLILCIDVNEVLTAEPCDFVEQKKAHLHLLERFGASLGYPTELAVILTKMDSLAGFTEFYQTDHTTELSKPLGFSIHCVPSKQIETYAKQFNQLIELTGQKVINKIHPVRSTIKRSLIREFPLQLASIRSPLRALLQGISPKYFNVHSIYFTSAEQGGLSIDRLNKKIQDEYALTVQDTFPQATNFRAYFVEGAIKTIQEQCAKAPQNNKLSQKPLMAIAASITGFCLIYLASSYYKTAHLLDKTSHELLTFEKLNHHKDNEPQALYHLSKAANSLAQVASNPLSQPSMHQLKSSLSQQAKYRLQEDFLPSLTTELEQVISNPSNSPLVRYKSLKIYLMLGKTQHFSATQVHHWFESQWKERATKATKKKLALLNHLLSKPLHDVNLNQQIISDARNYLNALPASFLYYSLAKEYFPSNQEKITIEGFNLASSYLPVYFTKTGFNALIKEIPMISNTLESENWVLNRQDLAQLEDRLLKAYCFDYVSFWHNLMQKSQPLHYQDYQQGRDLAKNLHQTDAIIHFVQLIQKQTKPDLTNTSSEFNQLIANQFTDFNLMGQSNIKELNTKLAELEQFISTLSVINDGGKTAFTLTKARFINENASDPISALFNQAKQSPEPLKSWTNQLAGDTWAILIKDSRQYINHQWQQTVYTSFQNTIANRYPFDSAQTIEIAMPDFNHFFSTHGVLNGFTEEFVKPFLDVSSAQWKPKAVNDFVLPISSDALDAIIRANIITNMFYPDHGDSSHIEFTLQKISLDPVVSSLRLEIGQTKLTDTQGSDSFTRFNWPESNAKLALDSIEGHHYELAEVGTWALFKLLEKVNVLIDEQDSSSLQILFEVNSNSGRYLLKTQNKVNPFTPGILNGFSLTEALV